LFCLVYKSNYNDDLCVYSNKCLSPSLTSWAKLNNENLESEMLKCMIEIRNKKNKLLPFINFNKEDNENEKSETNPEDDEENQQIKLSYFMFYISLLVCTMAFLLVLFWNFTNKKKSNEMNIQVNPHSIDKTIVLNKKEEKLKEFTQEIIETKQNITKKNENKSNIVIDKENILGFGANGTIVYNGLFQNREMAIKRIIAQNADLAIQEMEILMKLDHPNIIKFYYFEEKKFVY